MTASHCQWAVRKGAFFSATASSTAPPRPRLGARTPGLSVLSSGPRACRARGLLACRPAGLGFCCHCPTAGANAKLGSLWEPTPSTGKVGLPGLPSQPKTRSVAAPDARTRRCGTGAMLLLLTLLATHKDAVLPEALAKCEACRVMVESVHTNVDDYLMQNENGKGLIRFRSVARSPPPPPAAAPHVAVPRVAHTSRGRVRCRQRYGRRASQTAGSSHVLRHRKG